MQGPWDCESGSGFKHNVTASPEGRGRARSALRGAGPPSTGLCAPAHGRPVPAAHVLVLCTLPLLLGKRGGGQEKVGMPASPSPCPPVPLGPPENVSAMRNGSQALVHWQEPRAPLQGTLLGYRLAYRGQDTPEVGAAGWAGAEWLWRRRLGRRR